MSRTAKARSAIITPLPASVEASPMQYKVAPIRSDLEQQLTQVILTSQTPSAALETIAQLIADTFEAEGCVILPQSPAIAPTYWLKKELEGDRAVCTLRASLVENPPDWSAAEVWFTDALYLAEPSMVNRAVNQSTGNLNAAALNQPRACVVPTCYQGQTNGAIGLIHLHDWDQSRLHALQSVAPQVAIAISQAQLNQQLQQQVRYQTLIDRLTTAIRNAWELDDIFGLAVKGAAASLEVNRGLLLLFKYADPLHKSRNLTSIPKTKATVAAEWLSSQTSDSTPSSTPTHLSFVASDCRICQQVLRGTLEPIVVSVSDIFSDVSSNVSSNVSSDIPDIPDGSNQNLAPLFNLAPTHAILLMPLENQGTVLGCLVLHHDQPRLWSSEELSFVKLVAAQLSTAIIQTRTLQQIQGVVQERTAQLQRSLDVQAKLYEKTRQQVEQLRKFNEEREEFLSTVSHELRTPLTSMMLAIRMLRQADLMPDRQKRYLDILEQQCVQETNLINDMLALRKLETNQSAHQLQKADLRYLIQGAAQSIETSWTEKGLTLALELPPDPVTLYTDPESFNRILLELLTNARKYANSGSVVELKLVARPHSQVVLSLRNLGDGILPEELPHIFEKFRRGQGVTKRAIQGTGLGLALVKSLVNHLNGTIAAASQPCDDDIWETCFTLTLPQCPEAAIVGTGLWSS